MSGQQNVGDEEMKGDQQPSLKEVIRSCVEDIPEKRLEEVVQQLEDAMVYTRKALLQKSRETLKDVLGVGLGGSLFDALAKDKPGKMSVVLCVVSLSWSCPLSFPCLCVGCFLLLTWPRVRLCVFALCCSSCPPCAAGDF